MNAEYMEGTEYAEHADYANLVAQLGESGALGTGWRGAFLRTPRSLFVPERVWVEEGSSGYRTVTKRDSPEEWQARVNADDVVVTQLDDGAANGPGTATSSVSMPSLVARMLGHLDVRRSGRSVLEIGSGWTTGLLCARAGASGIVSVEIDTAVAARTREALATAGHRPRLVLGDGTRGCPEYAPYDRVSSTASVPRVPEAWVEQCKPGGVILTPWGTSFCNAGLLKLYVHEDNRATGGFVDSVSFMWMRNARPAPDPGPRRHPGGEAESRYGPSPLDPEMVLESVHAAFSIGLRFPTVRYRITWSDSEPRKSRRLILWDIDGSRAVVFFHDWNAPDAVKQSGPRNLWNETAAALAWWREQGKPDFTRFGMTVVPSAQQVWLDRPGNIVTTL